MRKQNVFLACIALVFSGVLPATAAAQTESDHWEWAGEIFALGAGVSGTTATGDDIDVPLDDLLDGLEFGLMGSLAARKDKTTLFVDFLYVDVGQGGSIPLSIPDPIQAQLDLSLKQFISTFGAAYTIRQSEKSEFSLLAGGRYLSMDADLDYDIGGLYTGQVSDSGSNWDFIVGARGRMDLNKKWYIHYYADIGGGDSDMTWQALAGINYRFTSVHLTLGYAYMDWEFDSSSALKDLTLSGPYLGLKFGF